MPVAEISDNRTDKTLDECDSVFEPSWHDDPETYPEPDDDINEEDDFDIEWIYDTTISDSIEHAKKWNIPVTIYLYNKGTNPCF